MGIRIYSEKPEMISTNDIKPFDRNPKAHPQYQIDIIKKSITEFGFRNPLLLNNSKDKTIVTGHGRFLAAKELNIPQVPCVYADGLSDAQIRAFMIMDNKSSESGWENESLREIIESLKKEDYDILKTGFNDNEIAMLMGLSDINAEEKEIDDNLHLENECPKCHYRW